MNGPIEPITKLPVSVGLRRVERHPRPADERDHPCDRIDLQHPDRERRLRIILQVLADSLEEPQISAEARQADPPRSARDASAWLLQAVNGILINDFLDDNPQPAPEVFDFFITEIRADLENGAIEARDVLESLAAYDRASRDDLEEIRELLDDSLGRFAKESLQELGLKRRIQLSAALRGHES